MTFNRYFWVALKCGRQQSWIHGARINKKLNIYISLFLSFHKYVWNLKLQFVFQTHFQFVLQTSRVLDSQTFQFCKLREFLTLKLVLCTIEISLIFLLLALPHYFKFLSHPPVGCGHILGFHMLLNLFGFKGWHLSEFVILTWLKQRMKSQLTHYLILRFIWGSIQIFSIGILMIFKVSMQLTRECWFFGRS